MAAIKIYEKAQLTHERKRLVVQEATLLSKIHSDVIIELYDVIEADRHIYLVMEFAQGKPLTSFIKERPMDDREAGVILA
jgi:serine/threonine protein kinase